MMLVVVLLGSILGSLSYGVEITLAQERGLALSRGRLTDAARLTGMARVAGLSLGGSHQGREAEALRLAALAEHALAAGGEHCDPLLIATRARSAEAARLKGGS